MNLGGGGKPAICDLGYDIHVSCCFGADHKHTQDCLLYSLNFPFSNQSLSSFPMSLAFFYMYILSEKLPLISNIGSHITFLIVFTVCVHVCKF